MIALGIDIGGSGIKGAPVDLERGTLVADRFRVATHKSHKPAPMADQVREIAAHFHWHGPIGAAFPAVVKAGVTHTAATVDKSWIGTNAAALLSDATGCPVHLVNDADAAGIAEMRFGAGKDRQGVVFVLTLGTGIGSAVFVNGTLMPNTELGHLEMTTRVRGTLEAEHYAADRIRKAEKLTWPEWGARVNEYLAMLEALFAPDLFILGGGVSKKHKKLLPHLSTRAHVVPATLRNDAGIVGAALAAAEGASPAAKAESEPIARDSHLDTE